MPPLQLRKPNKPHNPFQELTVVDIVNPAPLSELEEMRDWFKIDAVDPENVQKHLIESADNQAYLAQELAKAEYYKAVFDDAAKTREAHVFVTFKLRPVRRATAKGIYVDIDCSDVLAAKCATVDYLACRYRRAADEWQMRRDILRGYMESFTTKRLFLSSLCGINRADKEMETASRRSSY